MEAMLDLIGNQGTNEAKDCLNSLTDLDKTNLKLAAYFLRAGRVDESSHKESSPDDYNTRSALIYESYARELKINSETIDWTKKLIIDSCKPKKFCKEAFQNEKSTFVYTLLTSVHELDLIRCFDKWKISEIEKSVTSSMENFVLNPKEQVKKLFQFSKDLCKATGVSRVSDGHRGDSKTFADCSVDGEFCWNEASKVKLHSW